MLKIRDVETGDIPLVSCVGEDAVPVKFDGVSCEEIIHIADKIPGVHLNFQILFVIACSVDEEFNGVAAVEFVIVFFSCGTVVFIPAEHHEIEIMCIIGQKKNRFPVFPEGIFLHAVRRFFQTEYRGVFPYGGFAAPEGRNLVPCKRNPDPRKCRFFRGRTSP